MTGRRGDIVVTIEVPHRQQYRGITGEGHQHSGETFHTASLRVPGAPIQAR
ncbi:hypothetical protein MA5S0422_5163 [Mycobacteroides abscessus 5S-0422]|nr:hypothetical protein MBOL_45230 [Mycobacteroides abscessus subsp. bolletii BD]EIU05293.1 hypothetical protein MA5S0422_5163 [Mycobacteroides abscessus 5S-0422]EIU22409.1 hypothetical protein MA5S0708_3918 [Mycobacteroides abscessus 5S-0708]EIU29549.1 hypothetical protein MA5S1212_3673 [Mycobacteroides abscessus 5S-1212]CPU46939.1 Uncharacterised protein [Mycobacteroides abscessus]